MERVGHPALEMPEITASSEQPASEQPVAVHEAAPAAVAPVPVPAPIPEKQAPITPPPIAPQPAVVPADGIGAIIAVLERLRDTPLPTQASADMSPQQQMAALQSSTAMHLLHAGANMLLMYSGLVGQAPPAGPVPSVEAPAPSPPSDAAPPAAPAPKAAHAPAPPPLPDRPIASAAIAIPVTFAIPKEACNQPIRKVTLGGSGTRTSAVTVGGAETLPFRHYQGNVGLSPVVAMEVFDQLPRNYPSSLREAFGDLLNDPAAMARYCVEQFGAEAIGVRLLGTHPENGNRPPEAAAETVAAVLKAVGVPLIVTGPNHFEKNNAVMKHVAAAFPGENLALNWVETDNYKTIAAAAMGYGHCIVAQTPIDVNMCKQLNILLTNLGVSPEKILVDPMTGALGYGLEYTYSVMERIRTSAFTGDSMLAMPMIAMPGWEVARTKEARAPQRDFPLWGAEKERGALLEIVTAMALINAGADLVVMHHPLAARTVKRKIAEMMQAAGN
jgi:acetyl-CoA decarbonylase/synthase complex subunit delta